MGKRAEAESPGQTLDWLTVQSRDDDGSAQGGESRGGISTGCVCKSEPTELGASLVAQMVKNLPTMQQIWVQSLRQEDPLQKGKATHSSILTWEIPWTEEHGGLQSMGSQRVRHDCDVQARRRQDCWSELLEGQSCCSLSGEEMEGQYWMIRSLVLDVLSVRCLWTPPPKWDFESGPGWRCKFGEHQHRRSMYLFILKYFKICIYLDVPDLSCSMWDLVPWLGIEPGPLASRAQSLSHWTSSDIPRRSI